jgi:protease-4
MALDQPPRSRARWLVPLALLAILFAFCGGLGLLMLGAVASAQKTQKGTILELKLEGEIAEAPSAMSALFPGLAGPPSIFEVRNALAAAAKDEAIAGLRIDIENAQIGWGGAAELETAFSAFRLAGKPVHAYLRADLVPDIDYALALGADRIWLTPSSALAVNGFHAEVTFWRGTLDKLQIEPQYFMMKEYKSAGEPMMRKEMSEQFRDSTTALLVDIWEDFLGRVATRRGLDIASVRATANVGMVGSAEAQAAKWIDELGYEDQLKAALQRAASADHYRGMSLRRYHDSTLLRRAFPTGQRIAVVFGSGTILTSTNQGPFDEGVFSGPRVARAIRAAADDDLVPGILLRIDSPGGTMVGSDHVWRAVQYARKERRKPVVVSMASLAASGGYYVSAGADAIVAHPATITGSIGVVFGKVNLAGLYELAGAHIDTIKVGDNADMLSLVKTLDAAQSQRVQSWMEESYDDFKRKVGEGRKLDAVKVEELARGRVWSGTDAKDLGLVDQLGGYDEAIAILREKAGIAADAKVDLVVYPAPRTFLDVLLSEEVNLETRSIRALFDPEAALRRALAELSQPGLWLMMPAIEIH